MKKVFMVVMVMALVVACSAMGLAARQTPITKTATLGVDVTIETYVQATIMDGRMQFTLNENDFDNPSATALSKFRLRFNGPISLRYNDSATLKDAAGNTVMAYMSLRPVGNAPIVLPTCQLNDGFGENFYDVTIAVPEWNASNWWNVLASTYSGNFVFTVSAQ